MLSLALIPEILKSVETILSDVELLDKSETYICSKKALMAEYNGTYKYIKASSRITVLSFVTVNNGNLITITCSTSLSLHKNYKKMFLDRVSTFVFEDYIIGLSPVATTKGLPPNNA